MVKNISTLLTAILGAVSIAGVITNLQHKHYKKLFDEHSEEIRERIETLTKEVTESNGTLNNLTTEVGNLTTEVGNLKTEFGSLKTEVGSLKTEVGNLKTEFDDLKKRFNVIEDFNAGICRNVIKDIYYKYNKTQKIPLYERKMADSLYKIYSEQFHQNSYGQLLYQEICKWEIDTTDNLTM